MHCFITSATSAIIPKEKLNIIGRVNHSEEYFRYKNYSTSNLGILAILIFAESDLLPMLKKKSKIHKKEHYIERLNITVRSIELDIEVPFENFLICDNPKEMFDLIYRSFIKEIYLLETSILSLDFDLKWFCTDLREYFDELSY